MEFLLQVPTEVVSDPMLRVAIAVLSGAIAVDKGSYWIRSRKSNGATEERMHQRLDQFQDTMASLTRVADRTEMREKQIAQSMEVVTKTVSDMSRTMDRAVDRIGPILSKLESKLGS